MAAGTLVSKPTTSSIPQSLGSATVKPLDVMPTATALALPTNSSRYCRNARAGWMLPAQVAEGSILSFDDGKGERPGGAVRLLATDSGDDFEDLNLSIPLRLDELIAHY